jgi:exopolysaccharide production protein ExoQ
MTIPRTLIRNAYAAYVVSALILSTGAFITVMAGGADAEVVAQGSGSTQAAWAVVYAITLTRLITRHRQAIAVLRAHKAIVALLLLFFFSALWSIDPGTTLHQAVTLVFSAAFALDVSLTLSPGEQLKLVCFALGAIVLMSVALELLLPGFVPGTDELGSTAWRGAFATKNEFGRVIVLATVALLSIAGRNRIARFAILGFGILLGYFANTVGAAAYLVILWVVSAAFPLLRFKGRRQTLVTLCILTLVVAVGMAAFQNRTNLTALVGRKSDLTGRSDLWIYALKSVEQRPLLGYGYGAFWNSKSQPATRIREAINWPDAPHSHNQYTEVLLSAGMAGLAVYLWLLASAIKNAYIYYLFGTGGSRMWPLLLLLFVCIFHFTETGALAGNAASWILLCLVTFSHQGNDELESNADVGEAQTRYPVVLAKLA